MTATDHGRVGKAEQALVASDEARSDLHPSGFDPSRGFMLRPFVVAVQGFGEFAYPAASRGKALAEAWRSYRSCYNVATFKDFLGIARARLADDPGGRFGEPITIAGKPAFYVGERGQYIRFVRPGESTILLSHPADVTASGMSAFGQDAEERLEAKPASPTRRGTPKLSSPSEGGRTA